MPKALVDIETVLFPRADQDHIQSAHQIIRELTDSNPEYSEMRWSLFVDEYDDGRARLRIKVRDPYVLSVKGALFYLLLFSAFLWFAYT